MNIKLTEAIRDITGASGISIIEAILNGERDPYSLSRLADRCKKSNEDIARALEGTRDEDLIFIMGQHYEQYRFIRKQMQDLEPQLENVLNRLAEKVIRANDGCLTAVARSNKKSRRKSNKLNFDIEYLSSQVYGVNLMRIDGVQGVTVLSLMGGWVLILLTVLKMRPISAAGVIFLRLIKSQGKASVKPYNASSG
ncbi:MAG: hypothetical protein K2J10_05260 [Muribaculaceae bacterium]|nr:hypothetical protein [Muribaculaceae bacterium]